MARVVRGSALVIAWSILALAVVFTIVRQLNVTQITLVAVMVGMQFAAIPTAVAAVVFAAARSRVGLLVALIVTVALAGIQVPRFATDEQVATGPEMTVLTINAGHGEADARSIVAQVEASDADILAVQELTQDEVDDLTSAGVEKLLPYSFTAALPVADGTGLWSKTPLTGGTRLEGFGFVPVQADTTIDGVDLTVVSFHAMSPATPRHAVEWAADLEKMRTGMDNYTKTVLVAGDFNATWDHRQFRDLATDGFGDAAGMAGAGLFRTFPSDRPLAQLDHVVVSDSVDALNVAPVSIPGSDHLAVMANLRLPTGRTEHLSGDSP
ncbi:endonuclease/exonuclease/phosphatase family protein [Rhodococcus sp. G-MC3]|uniref:endonuclease/exonuclease/phosphatase family protein n=1 Tax=Rhodococcus sp. G-MC3 TaxID=3046209 RepID=UPI0024BA5794|nr:endonuclease/exonuclease/phosphatase family protein [Rhodococcus sp. G-MC3]MDJ0395262.1 endonuclease/exonuclease/phosphatase family protein [Rhodococcus sp. G-MC3]